MASEYELAVIPMLVCEDGFAEIEFLAKAFGAVEHSRRVDDGVLMHATLAIGAALVMVHGETQTLASRPPAKDGTSPVVIYLYVADVDEAVARAVKAGGRVLAAVQDLPWGDRMGRIIDPAGHVWNVARRRKP